MHLIVIAMLASVAWAQYPYQGVPGSGGHQSYQPQPQSYQQQQPQSYQPQQQSYQPQPQAYQPPPQQAYQPPQQQRSYNPAPVHYVNIGTQLQGDYKFGYDTGRGNDGQSFREETRLPDGSVQGAYGYVDDTGKQRIVKYTAGKDGYKAEGDVGPAGLPQSVAPGPAPQPVQNPHAAQAAQQPSHYGGGYQQGSGYQQHSG